MPDTISLKVYTRVAADFLRDVCMYEKVTYQELHEPDGLLVTIPRGTYDLYAEDIETVLASNMEPVAV